MLPNIDQKLSIKNYNIQSCSLFKDFIRSYIIQILLMLGYVKSLLGLFM